MPKRDIAERALPGTRGIRRMLFFVFFLCFFFFFFSIQGRRHRAAGQHLARAGEKVVLRLPRQQQHQLSPIALITNR